MKPILYAAAALLSLTVGCSSSETTTSSSSSSSSGTPASSTEEPGAAAEAADAGSTTPAAATLKAPKIDSIMKMSGALHVTWTNNDTTADSVEVERQSKKADGTVVAAYKVVYTLPADVDNKHDMGATEDLTYTYRARCKKGTTYSDYSNEKSANPKQ